MGAPVKLLFKAKVLEKANNSIIAKLFDKSICLLLSEDIKHNNELLFLSNTASYMVKAMINIKAFYLNIKYVTCLAHSLHRVAEKVRKHFPKIDSLISNVKKIFIKCPPRVLKLKKNDTKDTNAP